MIALLSTAVKPDIATLCNELTSISDWFTLGVNLGVPHHQLEEVCSNYSVEGLGACIPMCCAYLHVASSTFYVITAKMIEDARDATEP